MKKTSLTTTVKESKITPGDYTISDTSFCESCNRYSKNNLVIAVCGMKHIMMCECSFINTITIVDHEVTILKR